MIMNKVLILLLLIFSSSFAETIILKNGQNIQGKVLGHDSESITISINGESKLIPKSQVHKVVFSSNHVEIKKIIGEKKSPKNIEDEKNDKVEDEETNKDEDTTEDRKNIALKLQMLKQSQEKYEKKLARIRLKIQKLKQKLKSKKVTS